MTRNGTKIRVAVDQVSRRESSHLGRAVSIGNVGDDRCHFGGRIKGRKDMKKEGGTRW